LHARNAQRGKEAWNRVPGAAGVLTADLSSLEEAIQLAGKVNATGLFDAVIHNAAVYQASGHDIFMINTLAPYVLTCLIKKPKRLIYMSSGLHFQGHLNERSIRGDKRNITYSDSKFHMVMLAMATARKWTNVYSNAVNPGWVPTKMGGKGAPDDLDKGYETQVWLATSDDEQARVSGRYFFHQQESRYHTDAVIVALQDTLLEICREVSGIPFPSY
jgi:NAD(P)-dependent dehydrogenase (short-subunit alcohol dehydrogenase family)